MQVVGQMYRKMRGRNTWQCKAWGYNNNSNCKQCKCNSKARSKLFPRSPTISLCQASQEGQAQFGVGVGPGGCSHVLHFVAGGIPNAGCLNARASGNMQSADVLTQVTALLQSLNLQQLRSVFQSVGNRMQGFQPDQLGQMQSEPSVPGFMPGTDGVLPDQRSGWGLLLLLSMNLGRLEKMKFQDFQRIFKTWWAGQTWVQSSLVGRSSNVPDGLLSSLGLVLAGINRVGEFGCVLCWRRLFRNIAEYLFWFKALLKVWISSQFLQGTSLGTSQHTCPMVMNCWDNCVWNTHFGQGLKGCLWG